MLRGKKEKMPKNKNDRTLMASIHNRFDIEVIDAKTGVVKQRAKAENVILNNAWSYFTNYWFYYIQYGSGRGTPSPTDTTLFNYVGGAGLSSSTVDVSHIAEGYISWTKSCQLSETTAVGVNITEVGIARGSGNTAGYLMTHAMLQDMNCNPISILKTSTDIINLYATVFLHWDTDGYDDYIDVIPSSSLDDYAGDGASSSDTIYLSKGKGIGPQNTAATVSYSASLKTLTYTGTRLTVSQGNVGGFSHVCIGGKFYVKIPGPFRVTGEAVGTGNGSTVDFATKFDFPDNAVVYVDGVAVTNVTVSKEPLSYNNLGRYFYAIDEKSTPDKFVYRYTSLPDSTITAGTWQTYGLGLFYNPYHDKWGIDSYNSADLQRLEASNDLVNWEVVYNYTYNSNDPDRVSKPISDFRDYKFWRTTSRGSSYSSHYWGKLTSNDLNGKNIHFETPPAAGSVITIDYDTPDVPKDENHVYDCIFKVQLGAYEG